MTLYALSQYFVEKKFHNPIAYTVVGDSLYVAEKENNAILKLKLLSPEGPLTLEGRFPVEKDDKTYYYMIRRLYPGPNGVVVRSFIYEKTARKFLGYRFREYTSFSKAPKEIFTIYLTNPENYPDVNYAFDKDGIHYFLNNCAGQKHIWKVPPEGNVTMRNGIVPMKIRALGEKNEGFSQWANIYVAPEGKIFVSSIAPEKIFEYSPEGLHVRVIGMVGFEEGQILAPNEVFFTRIIQERSPQLTVASTRNRTWVQFNPSGKVVQTAAPLKTGYPFPDIYVGRVYALGGTQQIGSFDLVNKSLVLHGRHFKAITTYKTRQIGKTSLLLAIAVMLFLCGVFYERLGSFLIKRKFPFF